MKILILLFLLPILTSSYPAGGVHSADDFENMIANSRNTVVSHTAPPISQKEMERWGANRQAPDMKNRSCEEKIFMVVLSACPDGCTSGTEGLVAEEICKGTPMTDEQVQSACCPKAVQKAEAKKTQ